MRRLFKYLILAMSKLKKTCIYSFSFCYRIRHHHLQKEISHVKLRILLDLVRFCLFPLIILGKLFLANSRKGIFFLGDILQLRRCLSLRFFIPFIFIGLLVSLLDDHTLLIDTTIKTLRALLMRSSGLSLLSNLAQTSTCMRRHHCWITHPPTLRRQSKSSKEGNNTEMETFLLYSSSPSHPYHPGAPHLLPSRAVHKHHRPCI